MSAEKVVSLGQHHRVLINNNGMTLQCFGKIKGWKTLFCMSAEETLRLLRAIVELNEEKQGKDNETAR